MLDTIVVGSGIFGQTIAAALRRIGHKVLVVDDAQPLAGSKPSACLMRPSWFSAMGRDKYQPALELLDELFGIEDIEFDLRLLGATTGRTTVHWCDPRKVLAGGRITDRVSGFIRSGNGWLVTTTHGTTYTARHLILAAGVWTAKLVDVPNLCGRTGVAFIFPNQKVSIPFIQPWAPFKQIVAFNRGDGLWLGDGSSIKTSNWTNEHIRRSFNRCAQVVDISETFVQQSVGIRPYVKGLMGPCLLVRRPDGLWMATGGAKNGMIAAGWVGYVISRRLS